MYLNGHGLHYTKNFKKKIKVENAILNFKFMGRPP